MTRTPCATDRRPAAGAATRPPPPAILDLARVLARIALDAQSSPRDAAAAQTVDPNQDR